MEKSIFEIQIGDKVRGFKFGTLSMGYACQKINCTLGELSIKIDSETLKPLEVVYIIEGGARAYNVDKKIPIDFDESNVADWIDELGFEVGMKLLKAGLEIYVPKNSAAPETGQKSTEVGQSTTVNTSLQPV